MKALVSSLLIVGLTVMGCSSQKKIMAEAPLEISKSVVKEWYGGREESGTGFLLEVSLADSEETLKWRQAYFRGKVSDLELVKENGRLMIVGKFNHTTTTKPDIIMDADPKKEVGNQPPSLNKDEKFPFDLSPSEAILSYEEGGKVKYFKVEDIKEGKPALYQQKPRN